MAQTVIDNPILNSPFEEPNRYFRCADDGITNEIVEGRRPSGGRWLFSSRSSRSY